MIRKKPLLLLIIFLSLCLLSLIAGENKFSAKTGLKTTLGVVNASILPTHTLTSFDEDTFYAGVAQSKKDNKSFNNRISGGIIPHHLLPGFIIADFFNRLSKQNPKTIILIGPNHYESGDYKVLSSLYGWETPFGIVEPNEQIIQELVKNKLVKIDELDLPKDHVMTGIIPFIKYYLPETKVVPLLLSSFMTEEDARTLSYNLSKYISNDIVVIASVDFSHYLTSPLAQEKDKITLELMKKLYYKQIFSLNNDYLDSPPSIATLLMTMQSLGATKTDLLYHTNSGEIQRNNSIETTSYFSIAYY